METAPASQIAAPDRPFTWLTPPAQPPVRQSLQPALRGTTVKPELLSVLQCPACHGELAQKTAFLECLNCGKTIPIQQSIPAGNELPVFTEPPAGMQVSDKLARSPEMGTPWRRANWSFLQEQLNYLPAQALILDVGAGRGDFTAALRDRQYIELEVFPYPEIDVVCDLTQVTPFRPDSFDAILKCDGTCP